MSADNSGLRRQIEALREVINDARSMPMSSSAMINRQDVLDLIDGIEEASHVESQGATQVLAQRDAVVADAEATAAEVVHQAALEQEARASDTEVYRVAQRQADELRVRAEAESAALRSEAETYIEQRFTNFEHALERTLGEVRRGISNLGVNNAFHSPEEREDRGTEDVLLTGPDAG